MVSSLLSDRLTRRLGTGHVTAISVGMTAVAMFGFSVSHSFPLLCLWAIPYGLGAGGVDAALNNYVALHLASRHMSWLHCMWGIGASIGPSIMGFALAQKSGWPMGYRIVSMIQVVLTALIVLTLPIWKEKKADRAESKTANSSKALNLGQIFRIAGVKEIMVTFFCYCALEQTVSLWGSSYLVLCKGFSPETAARYASLLFLGITLGRMITGFLTLKWSDTQLVRIGLGIVFVGLLFLLPALGGNSALVGLALIGLGCAPIYPCIVHATPEYFGADHSQAIIGVELACSYVGNCLMPPLFGWIAEHNAIGLFQPFLLLLLFIMVVMHWRLVKHTRK